MKVDLPFMKNLLTPLAKIVLIPLGLTAAGAAADEGTTTLIISEKNIMNIGKPFKDSSVLTKGVVQTTAKE